MVGLFVGVEVKDLADTVIMVPLLQKFFLVGYRIALDEVLKLREVGR